MKENYPRNFTYQDFGSQLKMEFFNANKFADLVQASGAKYDFIPVISFVKMSHTDSSIADILSSRASTMMASQIFPPHTRSDGILLILDQREM